MSPLDRLFLEALLDTSLCHRLQTGERDQVLDEYELTTRERRALMAAPSDAPLQELASVVEIARSRAGLIT